MIEKIVFLLICTFLVIFIPFLRRIYFSENTARKETLKKEARFEFIDYLRGLAILAVIIIHVGDGFYMDKIGNQDFINLMNALTRFAVPVFLFSSGLLLSRGSSWPDFYGKKIFRTFFPYIVLSVLVGVFWQAGIANTLYALISGTASIPYYFIIVLLELYLIFPFVKRFSRKKYFLHFSFLLTIGSFFIEETWGLFGIPLFFRYFFFFAYGMHLKQKFLSPQFSLDVKEKVFWLAIVFYYICTTLYFDLYFYNTRLFFAIAFINLVFLLKGKYKNIYGHRLIEYLGRNSLWIYLVHYFVIESMYELLKTSIDSFYLHYGILLVLGLPLSILTSLLFRNIYQYFIHFFIIKKSN